MQAAAAEQLVVGLVSDTHGVVDEVGPPLEAGQNATLRPVPVTRSCWPHACTCCYSPGWPWLAALRKLRRGCDLFLPLLPSLLRGAAAGQELLERFRQAGVAHILHAGDVGHHGGHAGARGAVVHWAEVTRLSSQGRACS